MEFASAVRRFHSAQKFSWIHHAVRIKRVLDRAVQVTNFRRRRQLPPRFLRQADAVLAGDDAAPFEDLFEEFIETAFAAPLRARRLVIHHHVDVDVAIARVTKAGNGQAVLRLQPRGEPEQILEPAARHHDVLVELGEAGVTQRIGEFTPQAPELFHLPGPEGAIDETRLEPTDNFFDLRELPADGRLLAVEFNEEDRVATVELPAAGAFAGGGKRELVGDLEGAGQEAGGKNRGQGPRGGGRTGEADAQANSKRRERNQLQRRSGDDAQQTFAAHEQAVQIKAGLVLVTAAASSTG
jgi:hypothetical protein